MKAAWILLALACVLLACGVWLVRSHENALPTRVGPDAAPVANPDTHARESLSPSKRSPATTERLVPAPPPTSPATASLELTKEEAQALEVEIPPGVIEGIVLRGRDPITTGGVVFYLAGDLNRYADHPGEMVMAEGTSHTSIDTRGRFRIAGLAMGAYTLAVDVGDGPEQETRAALIAGKQSRLIVIQLGTAFVQGHVWDDDGLPVKGARVELGITFERTAGQSFRTMRATAADGSYTMRNMPAGKYWFRVYLPANWATNHSDLLQQITLSVGEERTLDYGAPEPSKKWTGTLRTQTGATVERGGTLHMTQTDSLAYCEGKIRSDGTFRVLLRPGQYRVGVELEMPGEQQFALPPIEIGAVDLDHDLTIPGTRVYGVVIDESTGQPVEARFKLQVGLRLQGSIVGGPGARLDHSAHFVVDGVEPGEWLVSTHPLQLVGGDLRITVGKQDVEIPLRLTVKTGK